MRSTSAAAASDSLGARGTAWIRALPPEKAGGATELTPAVAPSRSTNPATAARSAREGPWGWPNAATTSTGSVPPPSCLEASSLPTRTSLPLGNWVSAWVPVCSDSAGIARVSSTAETATIALQGCAITRAVQPTQKRLGPRPAVAAAGSAAGRRKTVCLKKRSTRPTMPPGRTRSPSIAISAGSSVVAVRIETATTVIAPSAIERSAWLSTIHSPASEMITARPEKLTAKPEVASASERAPRPGRDRLRAPPGSGRG